MNLGELNDNYSYELDKDQFGVPDLWHVMYPDSKGKYYGDCEDYIMTLKFKVDGFKDLEVWTFFNTQSGHCMGKLGDKWIDCNNQKLVDANQLLIPITNWTSKQKLNMFQIYQKRAYSWFLLKLPLPVRKFIYEWLA